jgi:hypothetical protein
MDRRNGHERGILVSFSAMKIPASRSSPRCDECDRLQRKYQLTVDGIYSVVNGTFRNLAEKLTSLCEWQDRRDRAMEALYAHRKSHSRSAA